MDSISPAGDAPAGRGETWELFQGFFRVKRVWSPMRKKPMDHVGFSMTHKGVGSILGEKLGSERVKGLTQPWLLQE